LRGRLFAIGLDSERERGRSYAERWRLQPRQGHFADPVIIGVHNQQVAGIIDGQPFGEVQPGKLRQIAVAEKSLRPNAANVPVTGR